MRENATTANANALSRSELYTSPESFPKIGRDQFWNWNRFIGVLLGGTPRFRSRNTKHRFLLTVQVFSDIQSSGK